MSSWVWLAFCAVVYMLPAIVAGRRGHRNAPAITVLTICLGWTFLGWVAALVWAFTDHTASGKVLPPPQEFRDDLYVHPSLHRD